MDQLQQWMPMLPMQQIHDPYEQQVASNFLEATNYDPAFNEATMNNSCISLTYPSSLLLKLSPQEIANSSYMFDQHLPRVAHFQSSRPIEKIISGNAPDDEHGFEFDCSAQIKNKVKLNERSKKKLDNLIDDTSNRLKQKHILSEKRRRERIRERMKLLHQLLPHCRKSGAAEVLDEAIKYIKAIRLQLQIVSNSGEMIPRVDEDDVARALPEAASCQCMHVPPPQPLTSSYGGCPLPNGVNLINQEAALQIPFNSGTLPADKHHLLQTPPLQIPCTAPNTSNAHMFYCI